jgi:Rv0623-like transcription factor
MNYTIMALNIKNPEVERLAQEVASLAKETKTEAIRRALMERRPDGGPRSGERAGRTCALIWGGTLAIDSAGTVGANDDPGGRGPDFRVRSGRVLSDGAGYIGVGGGSSARAGLGGFGRPDGGGRRGGAGGADLV